MRKFKDYIQKIISDAQSSNNKRAETITLAWAIVLKIATGASGLLVIPLLRLAIKRFDLPFLFWMTASTALMIAVIAAFNHATNVILDRIKSNLASSIKSLESTAFMIGVELDESYREAYKTVCRPKKLRTRDLRKALAESMKIVQQDEPDSWDQLSDDEKLGLAMVEYEKRHELEISNAQAACRYCDRAVLIMLEESCELLALPKSRASDFFPQGNRPPRRRHFFRGLLA